jgi:hypothetical protein
MTDRVAALRQLQAASIRLEPTADAALAALAGMSTAPPERAELVWQAAELCQRRGRWPSAVALLHSLDHLLPPDSPGEAAVNPWRRRALERLERLLFLQGELDQAWQVRQRLRALFAASANPEEQAEEKAEPLRQWRLELGADAAAVQALQALHLDGCEPEAGLQALLPLIERHPQATVLAFALQQQWRRLGRCGWHATPAASAGAAAGATIPHTLWLLRPHPGRTPELEALEQQWRDLHPGWTLAWVDHDRQQLWDDQQLPRLVRAACSAVLDPSVRGDLLRLALLWQHGGVAPEWQTAPLQSLEPLLADRSLLLTQSEELAVSLDLVAAAPRHPWVAAALQAACRHVLEGQGYSRWDLTGECQLSGVFARWALPQLQQGERLPDLLLLPLPELRRWLRFWVPLPRPAELPPEPAVTTLFDQRQRRRAQRWLVEPPALLPPDPAAAATPPPALDAIQQACLNRQGQLDHLGVGWLPLAGQIQHTIEAVLRDGQQPLILDAGSHDGRSACWLAQHWPGAEVVCLVQRQEDQALLAHTTANSRVQRLASDLPTLLNSWLKPLAASNRWQPLLLHLDVAMEGLPAVFAAGGDWLQQFAVVLLHGALQMDQQARLLPQPHHQALAAAGFDLVRSGDVLVAFQRGRLKPAPAAPLLHDDLPELQGRIRREGGVVAFDGEWQTPAITEAWACHQALQRLPERSDSVYLGFPWASLIDHLNNGTSRGRALLRQLQDLLPLLDGKERRFTVCQQIFFQQHRWLFELAGITDLFWPHATIHADVPGMRIHPFPLYPVHWQAVGDGQGIESRPIHYSFIGACSTPLYISNSRDFILSALKGLPGSLIEGYSGWYYDDHVYRVQIRAELTADDPAVCGAERQQRQERYVQVLQQSVFALCPSGTGPNSIRLWEAIGCGAIPVVLSDRWRPPGSRQLWEQAVLFVPDTAEGVLSIPNLVAACLADGELLQDKRNALRRIWQLYGPRGFTTDLEHLWRSMG